jgi:hypothetical protein
MRLYHPKNGYHFETDVNVIEVMKKAGWVDAPKGFFQNTLKEVKEKPKKKPKAEVLVEAPQAVITEDKPSLFSTVLSVFKKVKG